MNEVFPFFALAQLAMAILFGWIFYRRSESGKWGYAIVAFVAYVIISLVAFYIASRIMIAMGFMGGMLVVVAMTLWFVLTLVIGGYVDQRFTGSNTAR